MLAAPIGSCIVVVLQAGQRRSFTGACVVVPLYVTLQGGHGGTDVRLGAQQQGLRLQDRRVQRRCLKPMRVQSASPCRSAAMLVRAQGE